MRLVNTTNDPLPLRRHEHICVARPTEDPPLAQDPNSPPIIVNKPPPAASSHFSDIVRVDPDNILPESIRLQFQRTLQDHDTVFSPDISGYNGAAGPVEAVVNMGPVLPPQRKGRVPQYSRNQLVELQSQFDELERANVFRRPEDIGVTVEYLNPSFLVKKPSGGHRLVTAFADVGRYSKPQPSLMPNVDTTLRTIAPWKYIIKTDLTRAFYQIPLSKASRKYCGVATPFKGIRVYTRCAMGMPGSETALEEMMCRVLGDLVQEGCVAKLADDLYCGGDTPDALLHNWKRVLDQLQRCNLRLSPTKTVICPVSSSILGWIWSQGTLSASPHRIAVLSSCPPPPTVKGLRSFIGAYKILSRVLPHCSDQTDPLECAIAGSLSSEKVQWSEHLLHHFKTAQQALSSNKAIVLPRPDDKLWIVTDGSVTKRGLGATLYVTWDGRTNLAGFFSAKLRKHQVTWLPCEVEALSIAAAVKHFSPYIINSHHQASVLTDSKPCVQAIEKLCRGEFSASPRVTSFLSTVSRYQVNLHHLAGKANLPSDFTSRNAPDCTEPNCQICKFIREAEDSVVRNVSIQEILNNVKKLPFTSRAAWLQIQSDCPDLRRVHAHLKQGTRPSRKLTHLGDVKRYLNAASISRDGLLIVKRPQPFAPMSELIIIPRPVLEGFLTALHLKLDHPSRHQLLTVVQRHFFALNLTDTVSRITESCSTCTSLKSFPTSLAPQSSESPPDAVGISFAADVMKRYRQLILVLRECSTSYPTSRLIPDEKHDSLRDALTCLVAGMHPLDGPKSIIRVDPAPGFNSLSQHDSLKHLNIFLDIGRTKNVNKNPVAERAVQELEKELLKQDPSGGPVTEAELAVATARLNARLRHHGLSSRELCTQRNQFNNAQIPLSDHEIILKQHDTRLTNHPYSEKAKNMHGHKPSNNRLQIGDLVYLYCDRDKSRGRDRYIIVGVDGIWGHIKKFTGSQLRASSYKVKLSECYAVSPCSPPPNGTVNNEYAKGTPIPTPEIPSPDITPRNLMASPHTAAPPLEMSPPEIIIQPPEPLPPVSNSDESVPSLQDPDENRSPDTRNSPTTYTSEDTLHPQSRPPDTNNHPTIITGEYSPRPQRHRKPPNYLQDYVLD